MKKVDKSESTDEEARLKELYELISQSDVSPPFSRFRYLHDDFGSRFRDLLCPQQKPLEEAWRDAAPILKEISQDDLKLPPNWIDQVKIHSWTVARSGGVNLLNASWNSFGIAEKNRALAGISNLFSECRAVGWAEIMSNCGAISWAEKHLAETEFDLDSALEFGCNAIYYKQADLFERAVRLASEFFENEVDRVTPLKRFGESWRDYLEALPTRFIDVWLEAAARVNNTDAMLRCLECGADPNISIWTLERSFNEKNSLLSLVIKKACAYDGRINPHNHETIKTLLDLGADPVGTDYEGKNQAFYRAWCVHDWKLVDKMIDLGASFSGGNLRASVNTEKSGSKVPFPPLGLRLKEDEIEWAEKTFSDLIDFEKIESVPYFYSPNAQIGYYTTFVDSIFSGDLVAELIRYEKQGLPTRFTIATFLSAIDSGAFHCLKYLLGEQASNPEDAFQRIMKHRPDFATAGNQYMCRPEPNGLNVIRQFNTYDQPPITMPDGTRFFCGYRQYRTVRP